MIRQWITFKTLLIILNMLNYTRLEFHRKARELKYLLVIKESKIMISAEGLQTLNQPSVLIINGIHSGEIEGKDASMILLREILITKEKEYLLDSLNIIVVPIFSVDGHERKGKYNQDQSERT
ncbi:MAG: hypothetical protein MZV64_42160 [Ignavibacteriales bacterium]|nr:hypothetical protein [Ignavibacteriales bacterium]